MRRLLVGCAVLATCAATFVVGAGPANAYEPVGSCPTGFTLEVVPSSFFDFNGDHFVCLENLPSGGLATVDDALPPGVGVSF
jgi:hypothetical protein